jgi:hypothetical protein
MRGRARRDSERARKRTTGRERERSENENGGTVEGKKKSERASGGSEGKAEEAAGGRADHTGKRRREAERGDESMNNERNTFTWCRRARTTMGREDE